MKRGFREQISQGLDSGAGITEQVMGSPVTGVAVTNRHKARMLDIMDLAPDRTQPRRPMPAAVRSQWDGTAATVQDIFRIWWATAQDESGRKIDIEAYLFTDHDLIETDDDESDDEGLPAYHKLMVLLNLAYDIARRGLDTPIEVADGRIIYGERRWLAFQLLHWFQPDNPQWAQIPAILSSQFDVWKQAAENGVHQQLNAIGIARMLAKLIMDIYGWNIFQTFESIVPQGASDRPYYAQVADGNKFKVPSNRIQDVVTVLGLKNPSQIRQYRGLLRLRDDVWMRADDEDRPEGFLRQVLKYQDDIPDLDQLWKKVGVTVVTPTGSPPPPSPGRPTLLQTATNNLEKGEDALLKLAQRRDPAAVEMVRKIAQDKMRWYDALLKSLDL